MLKKLGGAVLVAAIAFAGMAASAALAVRMTRPEPAVRPAAAPAAASPARGGAKARPKAKATAKAPRAPHPWDEACAAADSEAQLLIATADIGDPQSIVALAREGIGINVRLYKTLRSTGGAGATGRAFLVRLERGIADDTKGLSRLQGSMTRAELRHWVEVSREGNATLTRLANKLGARGCADYFNG